MEIREYRDDDYDMVKKLIMECFGYEKSKVKNDLAHELVVCMDNKIIGYVILNEMIDIIRNLKIYHLDYLCVDPEYRGRKIGKTIMEFAEEYAINNGVSRIELTSKPSRVEAHKLYESCGYIKRETDVFRKELV